MDNKDKSLDNSHQNNSTKRHGKIKWILVSIILFLFVTWLYGGNTFLNSLFSMFSASESDISSYDNDYSGYDYYQVPWYVDETEYGNTVIRDSDGVILIDSLEWLMQFGDLHPFSRKGKKGYFNTSKVKVDIPAKYDYVWMFKEGKAAVVKEGRMFFINSNDSIMLSSNWEYVPGYDYIFRNGYCLVCVNDKMGLIDSLGHYVLPPQFIDIYRKQEGFYAVDDDHSLSYYNLKGELVRKNCITSVSEILVSKKAWEYSNYDVSLDYQSLQSNCLKYEGEEGWYGLMSHNGTILTKPIYKKIYSITPDLFYCEGKFPPNTGHVVNSKGKIIN